VSFASVVSRLTVRVLFLTCHLPFPPISGGRRRELELIRRLGRTTDIHLVVVSKAWEQDQAFAPRLLEHCKTVDVFPASPECDILTDARQGVVPQLRRNNCFPAAARVRSLINRGLVDVVHCEGFYMRQLVQRNAPVPILIVEQNIEHTLFHQRSELAEDEARREAHRTVADLTSRAARSAWRRSTACGVLTPDDGQLLESLEPSAQIFLLPNGCDHAPELGDKVGGLTQLAALAEIPPTSPVALFVGNFSYQPNVDAVDFLSKRILPAALRRIPGLVTVVVGHLASSALRAFHGQHGMMVVGEVPSLVPFYRRATAVLAPLRIGGGVKVKVLEAFAQGKVVVGTSIAGQGLSARSLIIRDEPEAFAEALAAVVNDHEGRRTLERVARNTAAQATTWTGAAQRLAAVYAQLASHTVPAARTPEPLIEKTSESSGGDSR
jgi:glycosyltransferase involved in cell wall biosynthesis